MHIHIEVDKLCDTYLLVQYMFTNFLRNYDANIKPYVIINLHSLLILILALLNNLQHDLLCGNNIQGKIHGSKLQDKPTVMLKG